MLTDRRVSYMYISVLLAHALLLVFGLLYDAIILLLALGLPISLIAAFISGIQDPRRRLFYALGTPPAICFVLSFFGCFMNPFGCAMSSVATMTIWIIILFAGAFLWGMNARTWDQRYSMWLIGTELAAILGLYAGSLLS